MKNAVFESLDLNFPKQTARHPRPFWKDHPEFSGSLSIQDLLDPDYPDPLREAIARMEAAGYDVEGLWIQYLAMKWALRTNAEVFRTILDTARAKAAVFGMEDQP